MWEAFTYSIVAGATSADVTIEQTGPYSGTVYLTSLWLTGDCYRSTDVVQFSIEDAASIAAYGERPLSLELEQINDMNSADMMADMVLAKMKDPVRVVNYVRFLANFSEAFATAALTVEPNTRFAMTEPQTGISGSFYACRVKFKQTGAQLWVEIVPAVAPASQTWFIWDTADHGWDEGDWIY
jgi:hypothetical protein